MHVWTSAPSSRANPFACVAAGVASLWGPAHGGANEAVLRMLEEIGSVENIPACVARAKDKSDSFRLMGFGQGGSSHSLTHSRRVTLFARRPITFVYFDGRPIRFVYSLDLRQALN